MVALVCLSKFVVHALPRSAEDAGHAASLDDLRAKGHDAWGWGRGGARQSEQGALGCSAAAARAWPAPCGKTHKQLWLVFRTTLAAAAPLTRQQRQVADALDRAQQARGARRQAAVRGGGICCRVSVQLLADITSLPRRSPPPPAFSCCWMRVAAHLPVLTLVAMDQPMRPSTTR